MSPETRACVNCKGEFVIEPEDFVFYERMKVPAPHVCPDCRFKMRAVWRNEMSLYTGVQCGLCDKSIISMYNPKSGFTVYCNSCYRGDGWDSREYSADYNFSRPFFDQLKDLIKKVPKNSLYSTTGVGQSVNSDYTNCGGGLKNCSLCFNSSILEDSMYTRGATYSSNLIDSYFCKKVENCYECINVHNSVGVRHGQNSVNCMDCTFIENCSNLNNCIGCVNLRNKSFHILNKEYSKEEYFEILNKINSSYVEFVKFKEEFEKLRLDHPHRANENIKIQDCIGDYISESKNVHYSFEIINGEDSKWNFSSREMKDCYGTVGYGIKSELLLECTSTGYVSRGIGCWACEIGSDLEYSISCFPNNKNLIGCDSLKNSQYCILNKQYSKDEYEKIRDHIINELKEKNLYGLMMPPDLAPFAYNETIAQDNMPMSRVDALSLGFRWEDDIQITKGKETLTPESIPDNIDDVSDDIKGEVLRCVECTRNYKITEAELLFYRKMKLPIPRYCFYCRHKDRLNRRGPYKFWNRKCDFCGDGITTTYSPDRPEKVYCEKCYQKEVL
ncbi:MAG: hypothetical protein KBD48_02660 [Candidatus Pacebacteria bacterium]|nr:hypothetical protein [Candidatus Paceibacterota bacterium]